MRLDLGRSSCEQQVGTLDAVLAVGVPAISPLLLRCPVFRTATTSCEQLIQVHDPEYVRAVQSLSRSARAACVESVSDLMLWA